MITIALDEQGNFELPNQGQGFPFIGGIIYDDHEIEGELNRERKRIRAYLAKVCESVGCSFPADIHCDRTTNNARRVSLVKTKLSDTVSEFFSNGTFQGELLIPLDTAGRKGDYYIFSLVRSRRGKTELLKANVSELIKDNYASNLYTHMAEDIISRVIFHNPVISEISRIDLDIATRRVVLKQENYLQKAEEYQRLGYRLDEEHSSENQKVYLITNADVYRTAIEREMTDSKQHAIQVESLGVRSIYYRAARDNMLFLYLADIVCSMLGYRLECQDGIDQISEIANRANRITGHGRNLMFGYDAVDSYFQDAWSYLENNDYYSALSTAFQGIGCGSEFAAYYRENWFPTLVKALVGKSNLSALTMAIRKLKEAVRSNNLNQEKMVYIFEALKENALQNQSNFRTKEDQAILYELYDAGVSIYCHIGDSQKAQVYFKKCEEYARFISIEDYLRTRNKVVVFLCDSFQFDEALSLAEENVLLHEEVSKVKQNIFPQATVECAVEHAIALSQYGQVLAFMRDQKAEEVFLDALSRMEPESPNYLITESYLLHHYLDAGKKEAYDALAQKYFGNKESLENQFTYLIYEGGQEKNARFSMKFALYVFVKGLYLFHCDEISRKLEQRLLTIEASVKSVYAGAIKQLNGHPWEMIYKYLALIALKKGKRAEADAMMKKANEIVQQQGKTIQGIVAHGNLEFARACEDEAAIAAFTERVWQILGEEGVKTTELFSREKMDALFTYMYR